MLRLTLFSILVLLVAVVIFGKANRTHSFVKLSPYAIIIDGGSTGSRLHIFEFTKHEILRKGSARVDIPLSSFGRTPSNRKKQIDPAHIAQHLIPLFEYAATIVPRKYQSRTYIKYQATAGMRLLDEDEQHAVYDALYQGLVQHPKFKFAIHRHDIATLSGELEGFYGAVAANYLKGIIDVNLQVIGDETQQGPIGALDMGGSSTQIVFLPHPDQCENHSDDCNESSSSSNTESSNTIPDKLEGEDFFATSYLSYGVDQFRERLWKHLIEEHDQAMHDDECDSHIIANPCNFKGYEFEYQNHKFVGTGDSQECVREIHQLIPHPENKHPEFLGKHVGGVEHPPIRGKFFAMSLFYFSLDSLRELSGHHPLNLNWPNPSIQELYDALDGLCSRSWHDDLHDIQHDAHQYTRAEVLPHRCFEAVYMVTLLKDGFGFPADSRDITFTFLLDGNEVEWTLGMALSSRAQAEDMIYELEHPSKTKDKDIYSLAQEIISEMLSRPSTELLDTYN